MLALLPCETRLRLGARHNDCKVACAWEVVEGLPGVCRLQPDASRGGASTSAPKAAATQRATSAFTLSGLVGAPADSPEDVAARSGLSAVVVAGFLFENYLDFIDSAAIEDAAAACGSFSDAMRMITNRPEGERTARRQCCAFAGCNDALCPCTPCMRSADVYWRLSHVFEQLIEVLEIEAANHASDASECHSAVTAQSSESSCCTACRAVGGP